MNPILPTAEVLRDSLSSDSMASMTHPVATGGEQLSEWNVMTNKLIDWSIEVGGNIIGAIIIFFVGRLVIRLIRKVLNKFLSSRKLDPTVKSFVSSFVNILLTILLVIAVVGRLGVETTSFAALLASAGVALGMAMSGNLQNFAGGLVVLLLRPFKVGDYVACQDSEGYVHEIQIFHTILRTYENSLVYIPNGALSSGTIVNYSKRNVRRVQWKVSVEYGENISKVEKTVRLLLDADLRILKDPASTIYVDDMADSSVVIVIRAWVKVDDYWSVFYDINRKVYDTFNAEGINFPFPQLTVHQS